MQKSCADCGNLRTNGCKRPDHCVSHGYCDFRATKPKPWEICECGGEMVHIGGAGWKSDTLFQSIVRCKKCGRELWHRQDVEEIEKRKPPPT